MSQPVVTRHRWGDIPREPVTDAISRQVVNGEQAMIAHIHLDRGAVVPEHSHHNEQFSYVLEGSLRFWVGEDAEAVDVGAGEVLHLPSNVPHKVEALEDALSLDIFSPPRQDWLDGTDDYFRKG